MILVDEVVERLRALGHTAEEDFGPGPTEVMVRIDDARWLFACRDFNREDGGWEAVVDTEGDQEGLLDGPTADASADEVVYWLREHVRAVQHGWRTVLVKDLFMQCSYPIAGDAEAVAMSDCCRHPADSAVVVPAGSRFWRCPTHRGQINSERHGTPADMLAMLKL